MTLKRGSKGNEVVQVQTLLGIEADGIFGKGTEEAVKAFQKEHGLTADGIFGRKTEAAVRAFQAAKMSQTAYLIMAESCAAKKKMFINLRSKI